MPLDLALVELQGPGSLVSVGREGRLIRLNREGPVRIGLEPVDETVLSLVDLALERNRSISIVYPAPAGEVSVLLAAEIMIRRFIQGKRSQSVGIVTWDTTTATRTWEQLAISAQGDRIRVSEVFPVFRTGPEGESPLGGRSFRGVMIGSRYGGWPVDVVVVDHLSGPVRADPDAPTVRIFADALDPELERLADGGELLWGWIAADLALLGRAESDRSSAAPFSVAAERLRTMAEGVAITIRVAHQAEAEQTVRRLRDDLRTLSDLAGPTPPPSILRGMRVAWHHVTTLTSLPCRPSVFDRFAGLPPMAARATRTFEPEIAAWAKTLTGDFREVAEVVASDLGDLRTCLEENHPFLPELEQAVSGGPGTLVVVRTQTAARALIESLGGDVASGEVWGARVIPLRRLHREGSWARVVFAGRPLRWECHLVDSGLSPDVHVLVLGDLEAYLGRLTVEALREARARWASADIRHRTWRELVGGEPPPEPERPPVRNHVNVVGAAQAAPALDPFEALQPLLTSVPLAVGDEGIEDAVAEELLGGGWRGAVEAVEVVTETGVILLPADRMVDVREGNQIVERRARRLQPGALLLVGRREGRAGLLDAVSERLEKDRSDLYAAKLLIEELRRTVQRAFRSSGMTSIELFKRLRAGGCGKTYHTVRTWVDEDGPVAPRDFSDLLLLRQVLNLPVSEPRLRETFAGVRRWRGFRRAVGKALVEAARISAATSEVARVDDATGLSLADLRELVVETRVIEIRECPQPVPVVEIGFLRKR